MKMNKILRRNKINLLKFKGKENTLYLTMQKDETLDLYGIEIEDGIIYKINETYINKKIIKNNVFKNKKIKDIRELINNIICRKLVEEKRLYIASHLLDADFYTNSFCCEMRSKVKMDEPEFYSFCKYMSLDLRELNKNYIIVQSSTYNDQYYIVNLLTKDVEFYKNGKKVNVLDYYFDQEYLNLMLARAQYKRGIAPQLLNELVEFNNFLENKGSVRIVTKDNKEHTIKAGSWNSLENILSCYNDEIAINGYYAGEREDILFKNIKSIKYARKEHLVDTTCLISG